MLCLKLEKYCTNTFIFVWKRGIHSLNAQDKMIQLGFLGRYKRAFPLGMTSHRT